MPRPPRTDNPANVTVYLSQAAREALAGLCERTGMSKGAVVERLLELTGRDLETLLMPGHEDYDVVVRLERHE